MTPEASNLGSRSTSAHIFYSRMNNVYVSDLANSLCYANCLLRDILFVFQPLTCDYMASEIW